MFSYMSACCCAYELMCAHFVCMYLLTRVCLLREASLWPLQPNVDPLSLSLADEHNLSFQIHERLQHYEESKPVPVLDNTAALAYEVSFLLHVLMSDRQKEKQS